MKAISYNGTEDLVQNFCVTFTHNFNHEHSRFTNSFVIKAANVTKENALAIAEILFPGYTDIEIKSIDTDENTLTAAEYFFLQGVLKEKLYLRQDGAERRRKENPDIAKSYDENKNEQEYDKYLFNLIHKMETRMRQFPVYHT